MTHAWEQGAPGSARPCAWSLACAQYAVSAFATDDGGADGGAGGGGSSGEEALLEYVVGENGVGWVRRLGLMSTGRRRVFRLRTVELTALAPLVGLCSRAPLLCRQDAHWTRVGYVRQGVGSRCHAPHVPEGKGRGSNALVDLPRDTGLVLLNSLVCLVPDFWLCMGVLCVA